jgi:cytochrome c peroxidase
MRYVRPASGALLYALIAASSISTAAGLSPTEQFGKSIFFDTNLSIGANQSCADCHGPAAGWTGPVSNVNAMGSVYEGSIGGRFGNRKPPSSAYATPSPILHAEIDRKDVLFEGGNFWDGRATGERLGSPSAEQAQGPFLNPLEQALPDAACVVYRVCTASYPVSLETLHPGACSIDWPADIPIQCGAGSPVTLDETGRIKVLTAYDAIAYAIAAFEGSSESNAYTSKYDAYLAGQAELSKAERMGLNLFKSKGKCARCHVLESRSEGEHPLLTDFTFDNLGVPRNPANPFYSEAAFNPAGAAWVDLGLGEFLASRPDYAGFAPDNYGKQKVPTLRNVSLRPSNGFVKAYGHNGYFKSLKQIVHFYNTRDALPVCEDDPATPVDESLFTPVGTAIANGCWPEPEVAVNVNRTELGNLHLTDAQEDAIVEFLGTLSDGYLP